MWVCGCECVGCAGYFIIFAGCMIINLHLNHRHRRPCRADDWPVQVLLFFPPAWHFFQGCCCACGPLFGRPCRRCVCVDIHTTLLTTKCHMILCWPLTSLPLHLQCCTCACLTATCWPLFLGALLCAIFNADKAVKRTFKNKIAASSTCLALGLRLSESSCDSWCPPGSSLLAVSNAVECSPRSALLCCSLE